MATATLISAALAAVFTLLAWLTYVAARPAARRLQRAAASQRLLRRLAAGRDRVTGRVAVQLLVLGAGGALVVALASMFAEIMEAVIEQDDLTVVDRPVLAWLAAHHSRELTQIQIGITNLGSALGLAVMLVAAAVAAAAKLRSWRPIIVAVVVAGGIQLLVYAIKVFISRPRPAVDGRLVDAAGFSFPSGHSASAIACLGAVAWIIAMMARSPGVRATAWIAAGFLTFAIGLSRAYLGVHYPSDIIGGWILGATWLITVGTAAAVAKGWKRPAAGPRQKAT